MRWILCILVGLVATNAHADLYRKIDKDGIWHFSNMYKPGFKRWLVGHEKFDVADDFAELLGSGPFDDLFIEAGRLNGIPPSLLKAVAAQESGFNPNAVSPVGAMGLMQLMPATAKLLGVKNPFNPVESIHGGARFLRMMLDTFSANPRLAVAAYNCGEGPVRRVLDVPNIAETQDYVKRVFHFYSQFGGEGGFERLPRDFYDVER